MNKKRKITLTLIFVFTLSFSLAFLTSNFNLNSAGKTGEFELNKTSERVEHYYQGFGSEYSHLIKVVPKNTIPAPAKISAKINADFKDVNGDIVNIEELEGEVKVHGRSNRVRETKIYDFQDFRDGALNVDFDLKLNPNNDFEVEILYIFEKTDKNKVLKKGSLVSKADITGILESIKDNIQQ